MPVLWGKNIIKHQSYDHEVLQTVINKHQLRAPKMQSCNCKGGLGVVTSELGHKELLGVHSNFDQLLSISQGLPVFHKAGSQV